jgi:hypothetical protein
MFYERGFKFTSFKLIHLKTNLNISLLKIPNNISIVGKKTLLLQ